MEEKGEPIPWDEWENQSWYNWPNNWLEMTENEQDKWNKDNTIPEYAIKDRSWLDDYKAKSEIR